MASSKTLIFSLGTHGWDVVWNKCLQSHKTYAKKNGYEYFYINKIPKGHTNDQVVWTKLPLIREALNHYERVVFLDADCCVQPTCPPVATLQKKGKHMYFAPGFSGRINSGVIICHKDQSTNELIDLIVTNKDNPLPKEDEVGRIFGGGENGHIIHYCKNSPIVEMIDRKWNNNADPDMDDYIRHFSGGGPMWGHYELSFKGKIWATGIAIRTFYKKVLRKLGISKGYKHEGKHSFESLVDYIIEHYPLLRGAK